MGTIVIRAFNLLGVKSVKILRRTLKSKGKIASGGTAKSIRSTTRISLSRFILEIFANRSFLHIDSGRRSGAKLPPEKDILDWISAKGINGTNSDGDKISDKSLAYLIRRKIAKDGIEPVDLYSELNTFMRTIGVISIQRAVSNDLRNRFILGSKKSVDNPKDLKLVA